MIKLSVIIPTRNRADLLLNTLLSFENQSIKFSKMLLFFLITNTVGLLPPIGTLILVAIGRLKSPLLSEEV